MWNDSDEEEYAYGDQDNIELFTTEFDQGNDVTTRLPATESKQESITSTADSHTTALSNMQGFETPDRSQSASQNRMIGNQAARNPSAFKGKLILNSPVTFHEFQLQQLPDGYVKIQRPGLSEPVIVSDSRRDKATKALSSMAIVSIMLENSCKGNCRRQCYTKFNIGQLTSTRVSTFATMITSEQELSLFLAGIIRTQNGLPSPSSNIANLLPASKRLLYFISGVQVCLQFFCRVLTRQNIYMSDLSLSLFLSFSHNIVSFRCYLFIS